ncbi:MAG: hypothetical protein GWP19_04645 [Planctomycetia bacterium]|nr:hypothetical protein [Planctomycetia bacterium]
MRFVILISRQKDYSIDIIKKHVEYLKQLDDKGQLVMCGPFQDYDGGIVIIRAESIKEAKEIAESDPFISQGFSTYELRTLELSNAENNHMGIA